ncbi:Reverse transcriptase RNA-dependent DNA polymerase, partial [Macrophomina phaseolina MS6]
MFSHQMLFTSFLASLQESTPAQAQALPTGLPRIHRDQLPPEPRFYKDIFNHPMKTHLLEAIQTELQELQGKGVWETVALSEAKSLNKEVIPLTWVFKYKFDEHGWLIKVKARICVRGDLQATQQDTYAATLAFRIFRALIAIICAFDLEMRQYDVVNAFPHVPLEERTYCRPPEGMQLEQGQILRLLRALYGLKESPALWQKHFCKSLEELGLTQ